MRTPQSLCTEAAYAVRPNPQLASPCLRFHWENSQGHSIRINLFWAPPSGWGHTCPLGAHLKHSYPERVAQEVRGGNQHLPVAPTEVDAGQLVQFGVHPVQALVEQVLGRTKGTGDPGWDRSLGLCSSTPPPAHISGPGLRQRPCGGGHTPRGTQTQEPGAQDSSQDQVPDSPQAQGGRAHPG